MDWRGGRTPPTVYQTLITASAAAGASPVVCNTLAAIDCDGITDYEISLNFYTLTFSLTTDIFTVQIEDNGVAIGAFRGPGDARTGGYLRAVFTPTAGSHVFTASLVRTSGTGTCTIFGSATGPRTLMARPLT